MAIKLLYVHIKHMIVIFFEIQKRKNVLSYNICMFAIYYKDTFIQFFFYFLPKPEWMLFGGGTVQRSKRFAI